MLFFPLLLLDGSQGVRRFSGLVSKVPSRDGSFSGVGRNQTSTRGICELAICPSACRFNTRFNTTPIILGFQYRRVYMLCAFLYLG